MAAICLYNQYGHCKFADSCDKIHNLVTCDSFPCLDNTCPKRHPRRCRYYGIYRKCRFAERCSFLHCDGRDQVETEREFQASVVEVAKLTQEVIELRDEVKNLRVEIDRLGKGTDARLCDAYTNQKHLLGMIKDLKEELDVDKAKRVLQAAAPMVKDRQQIAKGAMAVGDEGDPRTCLAFPCMDITCLEHYTEEGDIRTSSREEGHVEDEKKGDRMGRKSMKKGKSVAPDKSFAANRTRDGHRGPGRGQK